MKKRNFFKQLLKEGKLELIEPSENICESYFKKARDCLKSARILLEHKLFENSISLSYYTMYNSLLALLFRIGIKSENHSASILLLKKLFSLNDLFDLISLAKKIRIDVQYYVSSKINESDAENLIEKAEEFLNRAKFILL